MIATNTASSTAFCSTYSTTNSGMCMPSTIVGATPTPTIGSMSRMNAYIGRLRRRTTRSACGPASTSSRAIESRRPRREAWYRMASALISKRA